MLLTQINKNIVTVIKLISTVLIFSAIGLEIWNLHAALTEQKIPNSLYPIFWVGRFAIVMHLIEGSIAAFYAPSKRKIPIKYGVYTFFIGTVGLLELFEENEVISPHDIN
ncbi:MAG: hypothetical protein F6K58_14620 [Symploca sp. SIO2E9]|nr:hypothetical protein [Symploca sp. SIO2E9]